MFILLPNILLSQIDEEFRSVNNLSSTLWEGDTEKFIINSDKKLQLNDSDEGSAMLRIKTQLSDYIHWKIKLNLDFNPSANNYLKISLLKSEEKELFALVGKNNDKIELYFSDINGEQIIAYSEEDFLSFSKQNLLFNIIKLNDEWSFNIKNNETELNLNFTQNFKFFEAESFEFECFYTKTRADKFEFEYFLIEKLNIGDNIPPKLLELNIINKNTISLSFSERLAQFK